jgi:hypothetical protein
MSKHEISVRPRTKKNGTPKNDAVSGHAPSSSYLVSFSGIFSAQTEEGHAIRRNHPV